MTNREPNTVMPFRTLGPAMRLLLTLASARSRSKVRGPGAPARRGAIEALWELAERHHPEQAWLAMSWVKGERTLDELNRTAPREPLAPAVATVLNLDPFLRARTASPPTIDAKIASMAGPTSLSPAPSLALA